MRNVLRNTAYRKLFSAQVVALIGTGLLTVALGCSPSIWPAGMPASSWAAP